MKARLKVLTGGSAGKELKLKEGQFLIGRSDSCHLRPRSEAISRKHCVFFIDPEGVRLRDLKSRNGTAVNGEKITGDRQLQPGDKISVGPLEFEVLMSVPEPAPKQPTPQRPQAPAPTPQKQPAAASAAAKGDSAKSDSVADDDIFGWLEEADEADREERMTDPSTRQFKVDQPAEDNADTVDISKGSDTSVKGKKQKKEPGKLPPVPEKSSENSQQAAADALKQFFKRS